MKSYVFHQEAFGFQKGQTVQLDAKQEKRLLVWLNAGICTEEGKPAPKVRVGGKGHLKKKEKEDAKTDERDHRSAIREEGDDENARTTGNVQPSESASQ